jgi:hypothetical protein
VCVCVCVCRWVAFTWGYYEVVYKIFRTGAAIYTAVVVARSTGPNRPNCEFRVLLRSFAATARIRTKMLPWTWARTHLAASPWQRPVSHFRSHPAVSGEIYNGCHPPPTVLPWFGTLWRFPISKNEIEAERTPVWFCWVDAGRIVESAWHSDRKKNARERSKNRGDGGTGFYMREGTTSRLRAADRLYGNFIFTASVRSILDKSSYIWRKKKRKITVPTPLYLLADKVVLGLWFCSFPFLLVYL